MQITVKYYYVFSKSIKKAQKSPLRSPEREQRGPLPYGAMVFYGTEFVWAASPARDDTDAARRTRQSQMPPLHHQLELIGDAELMAQVAVFAAVILHDALDGEEGVAFAHPQIPRLLIVGEHDLQ